MLTGFCCNLATLWEAAASAQHSVLCCKQAAHSSSLSQQDCDTCRKYLLIRNVGSQARREGIGSQNTPHIAPAPSPFCTFCLSLCAWPRESETCSGTGQAASSRFTPPLTHLFHTTVCLELKSHNSQSACWKSQGSRAAFCKPQQEKVPKG